MILDHARAAQPFGGVRTSEAVILFGRIFQAKYGRASQRARAISAWYIDDAMLRGARYRVSPGCTTRLTSMLGVTSMGI